MHIVAISSWNSGRGS